jgi:hypothetical protein
MNETSMNNTSLNSADPPVSLDELEDDVFLSSVAVIVCVVLLLVVVVALTLFTRLAGM